MSVNTQWKKSGLNIECGIGDGKTRHRTFNGLNEGATGDQIATFAQIISKLTGESIINMTVVRTDSLVETK